MKKSRKRIIVVGVLLAILALFIVGGVIGYCRYQKQNQELKEVVYSTYLLKLVNQTPEQQMNDFEEINQNHKYFQHAKINADGSLSFYVTTRQKEAKIKLFRKNLKNSIKYAEEVGVKITVNEEDASIVYCIPKDIELRALADVCVSTLPNAIAIQLYKYDRDTVRTEFRTETNKFIKEANLPNEKINITTEELNQ